MMLSTVDRIREILKWRGVPYEAVDLCETETGPRNASEHVMFENRCRHGQQARKGSDGSAIWRTRNSAAVSWGELHW